MKEFKSVESNCKPRVLACKEGMNTIILTPDVMVVIAIRLADNDGDCVDHGDGGDNNDGDVAMINTCGGVEAGQGEKGGRGGIEPGKGSNLLPVIHTLIGSVQESVIHTLIGGLSKNRNISINS